MAKQALTPLERSIEHWKQNAEANTAEDASISGEDCALCNRYNTRNMERHEVCIGCPVYEKTKEEFCRNTPFYVASEAFDRWSIAEDNLEVYVLEYYKKEFREAALMEVDFLTSLLPENDK